MEYNKYNLRQSDDFANYERKYRAFYDAGVEFVSTKGYDLEYTSFLNNFDCGDSILECGCGEGFAAAYAAALGFKVTAIDSAPSAISKAKQTHTNTNVTFAVENVCSLAGIESDHYDIWTDIGCLHMIGNENEAAQYLGNAFRALKPLGRGFVQNRVSPAEARRWFPNMLQWIDAWEQRISMAREDFVEETLSVQGKDVIVRTPIHLGAIFRDVSQYVVLLTTVGFEIQHLCVRTPGVNSPFEAIITVLKPDQAQPGSIEKGVAHESYSY
jgi:SAM-dependent methyltransferase